MTHTPKPGNGSELSHQDVTRSQNSVLNEVSGTLGADQNAQNAATLESSGHILQRPHKPAVGLNRLNRAMGPIAAGMILDGLDFVTFGPVGLVIGLPVGIAAGYWLGQSMRLTAKASWVCAAAAGVYCSIPGTELLPLGTLVGALVRFEESGSDPNQNQTSDGADATRENSEPADSN